MASVQLQGETIHTSGELPAVGATAPDAGLVDQDLRDVRLHDFFGRTLIISAVPSLDTPTCALSSRRLEPSTRGPGNPRVLVVSADLPFAQGRFVLRENLSGLHLLSTMRDHSFAQNYGLLIVDGPLAGLCARALMVVNPEGRLTYAQLVPDIAQEPDYDAALSAAGV